MTEKIIPTNINFWNMTENVLQRRTLTGEYDRNLNVLFDDFESMLLQKLDLMIFKFFIFI